VEPLLEAPRRVLAVAVESDAEMCVAEDVVHGAEPVVLSADVAPHDRMGPVPLPRDAGHHQDVVASHRADQLVRAVVGTPGTREHDLDIEESEELVGLVDQPGVGRVALRTTGARREPVSVGDLPRCERIERRVHAAAPVCEPTRQSVASQSAMLRT
jgi:hypothetical protein